MSRDGLGIDHDHPFAYSYLRPDRASDVLSENWSLLFDGQPEKLPAEGEGVLLLVFLDGPLGCHSTIAMDGPTNGVVDVQTQLVEFKGDCPAVALFRTVALRIPAEKLAGPGHKDQEVVMVRLNGEANGLEFEL